MKTHIHWFDELDLDFSSHPVAMGTRSLGDRPWLIRDERSETELAIKADLLTAERNIVYSASADCAPAATELAGLVKASGQRHPLEEAARSVQEDLCLLERRSDGWYLDSGCVCFPTRWQLPAKIGRHITAVHGPVEGYEERIAGRVDRLFDQLTDRPVWRRNWFLMSDPTLFQPTQPKREPVIPVDRVATDLFIRSERQTLRRLAAGWIVFTIRIQQEAIGSLLSTAARADEFAAWVAWVSEDHGRRKHLTPPQKLPLLEALERLAASHS